MSKSLPFLLAFLLALPFCSLSTPTPFKTGDRAVKDKHNEAVVTVTPDFSFVLNSTCMPISVQFTDSTKVSAPDSVVSWLWDFGDGTTSILRNPLHSYTTFGSFTVKLTVTDKLAIPRSISKTVIIPNAYTARLTLPRDTTRCATSSIILDAGVPATSYLWIGPASGSTKAITAVMDGTYNLTVDSNGCKTRTKVNVTSRPPIEAKFSYVNQSCLPPIVAFSDLSQSCQSTVNTWAWDFGDGTTSILQNPVHTYTTPGQYIVTLTVTDALSNTSTSPGYTVIAGTPAVKIGPDTTICSSGIILDAGSNGMVQYLWSTGTTAQYEFFNTAGKYWVRVNNNGCVASDTMRILSVTPTIATNFGYIITPSCAPVSVTFTDSTSLCDSISDPKYQRTWDFGDGTAQLIETATAGPLPSTVAHSYAKGGTYTVVLTEMTVSGIIDTKSRTVVIHDGTVKLGADTALCPGSVLKLDARPGGTYSWSTGATTQTITVNSAGKYWVNVSNGACASSDTIRVTYKTAASVPTVFLGNDTTVCASTGLTMNAGNPGATYLWSTGATTQKITTFTAGTYWVKVDNGACAAGDTLILGVTPAINPNFGYTITSTCLSSGVSFKDSTQSCAGAVTGWQWNFGDGATSTLQNPLHTYTIAGTYTVVLTATNSGGYTQSKSRAITVAGTAAVNLGNDTTICEGTSLTLNAGPGTTYSWNTGATTQTISVNTAGTYSVTVVNGSCTNKDTIIVGVAPALKANFGYTVAPACAPILVTFSDSSQATCVNTIKQWKWTYGDGYSTIYTSFRATQTHSYASAGTYNVTLQVTDNNGLVKSYARSVTVVSVPLVVNLGPDTTICSVSTLQLDATNAGATYAWSTGATTPRISVTTSGTYSVTVTSGTCIARGTIVVAVVSAATPNFGSNVTSKCLPVLVKFTDSSTINCSSSITQWSWDFNDGSAASTQQNPQHTYTAAGVYNVTLTITTGSGTTFTKTKSVTIVNTPLSINLGSNITTCVGTGVVLDAGNPGATYKWTPAGGLSSDIVRNPLATPSVSTLYKVTVTRCTLTAQDSIMVYVDSVKKPVVTKSGNKLVSTYAVAYQWYRDGKAISGATERIYKPRAKGYYTVKVSNSQGCEAVSNPVFFINASDLDEQVSRIHVKVAPNPGHGVLYVYLDKFPEDQVTVKVVSCRGRMVLVKRETSQAIKLDMTGYEKGIYFVVVVIDNDMTAVPIFID